MPGAAVPLPDNPTSGRGLVTDLAGGLVCGIICVPYAASFAALLFNGPLAVHLGAGVSIVLFTALIGAALSAALSSFPFGVTNPDSNTTAILAVILAAVAERVAATGGAGDVLPNVLATLFVAALATGGTLLALGTFRAGKWVRYFPYPVMGGYLAATGWLIAAGALKVSAGTSLSLETARSIAAHGPDPRLIVAVVFGVAFLVIQKTVRNQLATPIALVAASALTFLGLRLAGLTTAQAREAGWLFEVLGRPQWFPPWQTLVAANLHWDTIALHAGGLAALVAVAAITNLLTAAGLEVTTHRDADLDKELRSGGVINLVSAFTGGYVAILSVSRTLIAYRTGARSRLTGVVIAIVCAAAIAGGSELVAFLPRVALGGLLLAMGLGLLYDWLVVGFRRLHREDYAVVVLILGTTIAFGFAVGVATGLLAACAAFALNYARTHVVRQERSGLEVRSAFERPPEDLRVLADHGGEILALQFQGYLFFGTAYAILDLMRLRFAEHPGLRFVVLDFATVQGLDTSAGVTFQKLCQIAERRGTVLVFVGLSAKVSKVLAESGCLAASSPAAITLPDLDRAMEWCEDRLLEAHRKPSNWPEAVLDRWLAAELGDPAAVARVRAAMERMAFAPGDYVFRQGDPPDALYLVESGRVSVVLERDGLPLRLRTYLGGTVVGEMGLYTSEPRSASVMADEPSVLLRLSAAAFAELGKADAELASALHSMVVRVLAHRLGAANAENAALRRIGGAS